jgi:hypothetical protein
MLVCERGDRLLLIDWPVKYKHCEIAGFARVDYDYREIGHTVTVEIPAYNVRMIVRNWLPLSPVSRCTDGAQILVACAVSVARKSVARMVIEPCGHRTVLACIQAVTRRQAGNTEQQESRNGAPDLEIH